MSVPSSKVTVTALRPKRDTLRTSFSRGNPLITVSTGKVMNCSTSRGPSAGALVSTCTCTVVTSGTASMGRLRRARTPSAPTKSTKNATTRRFLMENRMILSITAGSSVRVAFAQLAAE